MKKTIILSIAIAACNFSCTKEDEQTGGKGNNCTIDNTISQERLDCSESLTFTSSYSESTNTGTDKRIFNVNHIPDHKVGPFPNSGNPNSIKEVNEVMEVDLTPQKASSITEMQSTVTGPQYVFGIALNGVEFDPVAAEPWGKGTAEQNWAWNLEAMNNDLGFDCNLAHVQPTGEYHYHGAPELYLEQLNADGFQMVLAGWASDGFPVYYKYAYSDANDGNSALTEMTSSYRLKSGQRPGDGITAPCDDYNGKYVQDYEYVAGLGSLDECNGREGVTPEFPGGTYYYVITDEFPGIPRCVVGTPSDDFKLGPP